MHVRNLETLTKKKKKEIQYTSVFEHSTKRKGLWNNVCSLWQDLTVLSTIPCWTTKQQSLCSYQFQSLQMRWFYYSCSPKKFFLNRNILTTFKYGYVFCLQGPSFSNVIGHSPCISQEHWICYIGLFSHEYFRSIIWHGAWQIS